MEKERTSMLKVDVDDARKACVVEASGSIMDTAANILFVAASVYQLLKEHDPTAAETLQICIQIGVMDPEIWEHPHGNAVRIFVPHQ